MTKLLPDKNRLRIDWDLYKVQEGLLAPEDYAGALSAEQYRLLREREKVSSLSPALKKERGKLISSIEALEKIYEYFGDGLENWNEREAAIEGVRNYMKEAA